MSGVTSVLVSKGPQDVYLTNNEGSTSLFSVRYARHTNFSQVMKPLEIQGVIQANGSSTIPILSLGDLINGIWLEGDVATLPGTIFDLYIGGTLIDSQPYDFMADIWQVYLAESYTKCQTINNLAAQSDPRFFPFHFFFCDNDLFLPLLAIQHYQIEIRIKWGPLAQNNIKCFGNFIFLDTQEREHFTNKAMDIIITQTQKAILNTESIDLSVFNHPVKAIFFGTPLPDRMSFESLDIQVNGNDLLENASNTYFHTVQGYYHSKYGVISVTNGLPTYTGYYMYSFAKDVTSYKPTGTCNFSMLDTIRMRMRNPSTNEMTVYAVNYNVLKIRDGLANVMFA